MNTAAQQKKIYIAPDCHTDYYWTADSAEYSQAFLQMLDYYIDLNEKTAHHPYNLQSKWNCDGSYWVYTYSQNRNADQFQKLIDQIRAGKITVPLNTLNGLHGAAPTEAAIRDMYYAGSLERTYGLDLELAFSMEDHIMPLGLASIWAGAGAKYSWHGVCDCATKVEGLYSREHEFYWYTGLDDRRVLMKWQSLTGDKLFNEGHSNQFPGGYAEAWRPDKTVQYYKSVMNKPGGYGYDIASAFGKGWDNLLVTSDEFVQVAREYSDSGFQVIVSNEIDFFKDFEENYGCNLPSITASYGGTEWGKGIASLAEISATVKRSMEKLRAAEALFTLVAINDPAFGSELRKMKENAWMACGLYFEHDWTADSPNLSKTERLNWSREIAHQLATYVDTLYDLSLEKLGQTIPASSREDETFYVFNPLGWSRSDYCDYPYTGSEKISVIDMETSRNIPFQLIRKKDIPYLRIIVSDIPSLGLKTFEIKQNKRPPQYGDAAIYAEGVFENDAYKISVSTSGSLLSLIDKKNGKEYIQPQSGLYANDLGIISTPTDIPLKLENIGPVSVSLLASASEPVLHKSRITLFSFNDRIEIENHITQNISALPITYSFSFRMTEPRIWHEEVGAILNATPVSRGGHYAETQCRLDWLTINHFVTVSDSGYSIILSNRDAYFMKVGNSTVKTLDNHSSQIHILAGGQVDADNNLGFENQGGDSGIVNYFALKTGNEAFNPAESMKFSLEHQNPLIAGRITNESAVSNTPSSLFTVSDPDVLVWAVKPAEEGIEHGIIIRLWNMSDIDSECTIASNLPIKKCIYTNLIENNLGEAEVENGLTKVKIRHNGLQTFRLFLEN
ncbi:MAG: glycosyl hydrolase-related protein [Bacteroidales bacterium]